MNVNPFNVSHIQDKTSFISVPVHTGTNEYNKSIDNFMF